MTRYTQLTWNTNHINVNTLGHYIQPGEHRNTFGIDTYSGKYDIYIYISIYRCHISFRIS